MGEPLFDRASELGEGRVLVENLRTGTGGLLVIEGHAGTGKTAIVSATTEYAAERDVRTIVTRANQLEEGYAFAVVRQMMDRVARSIDPALWRTWLVGPAADAARILSPSAVVDQTAGADVEFALLHGLYWLAVAVSEDRPTLFVVDDAHWADEPSLRFLHFLSARIDTGPMALIIAARPGRADLTGLSAVPNARIERPRPLGLQAVSAWLRRDTGAEPGPNFAGAVREATSGNPFLLRELVREIALQRMPPDDSNAERVPLLAPDSVVSATTARFLGLGERALAFANSVAVLEQSALADAASLSGLTLVQARQAWEQLASAEVVSVDEPVRFQHPLMRTVIYQQMSMEDRSVAHERAAAILAECGADVELVAAHLLLTFSNGPSLVPRMREAARRARTLGSSSGAARYLRRALAGCALDSPERIEVKIELADVTSVTDPGTAVGMLRTVRESATELSHRTEAAIRIARIQRLQGNGAATVDLLLNVRSELGPDDHEWAEAVDIELLAASAISCSARMRLLGWLSEQALPASARSTWDHLLTANSALNLALDGHPAEEVVALAAHAARSSQTRVDPALYGYVMLLSGLAYLAADAFDDATAVFSELVTEPGPSLAFSANAVMLAHRASCYLRLGRLADAEADALRAMELDDHGRSIQVMLPRVASVLVSVAVERDEMPPIRYLTDDFDRDSTSYRHLAFSRAELSMARGHHAAAAEEFADFGRQNLELGYRGATSAWRSNQALCLNALGQHDHARELAEQELAIARRAGAPRAIGIALHACGVLAADARRSSLLAESVEVLSTSPVLLERARVLLDLAEDHNEDGRVPEARTLLRTALDLAHDAGSARLVRQVSAALSRAGARPTSRRSSGSGSLTPSERSICRHAVSGLSNREIAQTLFVTEKTVEAHLRNAYRKLGIRSRRDLPASL